MMTLQPGVDVLEEGVELVLAALFLHRKIVTPLKTAASAQAASWSEAR